MNGEKTSVMIPEGMKLSQLITELRLLRVYGDPPVYIDGGEGDHVVAGKIEEWPPITLHDGQKLPYRVVIS